MQSPSSPYESPLGVTSPGVMSPTVQPHSPSSPTPYTPGTNATSSVASSQQTPLPVAQVTYLCGYCGRENYLKPKDVIRCRQCGHRIMFKKRTNRKVQYEAR